MPPANRKPHPDGKKKPQRGSAQGKPSKGKSKDPTRADIEADLRIIGGKFRGTKLAYEPFIQAGKKAAEGPGAVVTRPMKHRVREAIFNLVGMEATGKHALDLFAGTGALGLEAISRGAERATFIERHIPTADVVKKNMAAVGVVDKCELLITSAFLWGKRDLPHDTATGPKPERRGGDLPFEDRLLAKKLPWLVFISPPYSFFVDRQEEMLELINEVIKQAPSESMILIESDERFDFNLLPGDVKETRYDTGWDVRTYSPAVVGVWHC